MRKTKKLIATALGLALAVCLAACDYIGGKTITVDLSSVNGVQAGDEVFFAGVQIGRTGTPDVVAGRAKIPVHLLRRHENALPDGAVFVVKAGDAQDQSTKLVGYDLGKSVTRAPDGSYPGFSNELEMAMALGASLAQDFWKMIDSQQR